METEVWSIAIGVLLLIWGRRLFWLFVGGTGFAAGLLAAATVLEDQNPWLLVGIALMAGLIGALIALFLQRIAVAVAGFVAGATVAIGLIDLLSLEVGTWEWAVALGGAVIGALAVSILFNWALIILSSTLGTLLILDHWILEPPWNWVALAGLLTAGIWIQHLQLRPRPQPEQTES